MPVLEASIELAIPAEVAYGEVREIEQFPVFLPEVERVEKLDDRHYRWSGDHMGQPVQRTLAIDDLVAGRRIAWRGVGTPTLHGSVTFEQLQPERCRITVRMVVAPPERVAPADASAWVAAAGRLLEDALVRFRDFAYSRRAVAEPLFVATEPTGCKEVRPRAGPSGHLEEIGFRPEHEIGQPEEEEGGTPGPTEL